MRTTDGTTIATVTASEDETGDDFVVSVRELLGNGSGAGSEWLAEHWHRLPCEPAPPLQQQQDDPLAPQQPRCCAEDAALSPQQECCVRDRAAQCGHLAAGAASTAFTADCDDWFPQSQAITGRVCTGTSAAASHTRSLTVMLSWSCTHEPRSGQYLVRSSLPRGSSCPHGPSNRQEHKFDFISSPQRSQQ